MKSIAAVAVSETPHLTTSQIAATVSETPHLTTSQIAAAGISTASVLLFLGATGLMSLIYRYLPLPVVRTRLRLLRNQVHPVQSGLPRFQIHHFQTLAQPRRNPPRLILPPLPRPH
ncbi:Molybdate transporter 2 [Linum perenne]